MLNIIQNTIGAIRRVGESVVRAGLKMWLPFTKAEPLGKELVTNGDFADATNWNITHGGWSASGPSSGSWACDGTQTQSTNLAQPNVLQGLTGKNVVISFEITAYTTGTVRFVTGDGSIAGPDTSGVGTYKIRGVVTSGSGYNINIQANSNFVGSVSNVSIHEYAQETPDISGNDNNAILKTGKALRFHANDSLQTSFPTSKDIKTIAFWIYPTASNTNETLFWFGGSSYGTKYVLLNHLTLASSSYTPTDFDVYVDGVFAGATNGGVSVTLTQDQWQRVVLKSSTAINVTDDTLDVAAGGAAGGQFIMSDLQVYGAEWTTDDIAYDYANPQKLVTDNASSNVTLNDLHAWWHMSEGDGTVAFDSAPLIGKELVVNGDFATDSNWYNVSGTGWEISGSSANHTGATNFIEQDTDLLNGITYIVQWSVTNATSGTLGVSSHCGDRTGDDGVSVNGNYKTFLVSNGNNLRFYATGNASISSVSVKEVYNIDGETYDGSSLGATYVDAQERIPQLGMMNWSKGSNLLEYSEDLTEWTTGSNATLTYESDVVAPDGTVGVYRLLLPAQNSTFLKSPTYAAGSGRVFSMWVKKTNNNNTQFNFYDGSQSSTTFTATDEWQRFEMNGQAGTNAFVLNTGDTFISDIYIWGGQVETGTTASAYRRTNGTAVTDATLISSATDSQKDILGNAVRVKGSGFNLDGTGYGEVPNDTSINPTNNISFSCWFYSNSESDKGLLSKWRNGSGYMLYKQTNTLRGYINGTFKTTSPIPQTGWIYACCTFDGSNIKVYTIVPNDLDAQGNQVVNVAVQPYSSTITNSSDELEIGRYNLQSGSGYSNIIDDAQVYDVTLTQSEILQNFNATKSGHNN